MNFKKLLSASAAALMSASLVFSSFSAEAAFAAENDSVLVLGDSIASGNDGATIKFSDIMASYLSSDDIKNMAKNGVTTSSLRDSVTADNTDISKAVADYDSIVISAGGHDYLNAIKSVIKDYLDEGDTLENMTEEKLQVIKDRINADRENAAAKLSKITEVTEPAYENVSASVEAIKEINPDAEVYVLTLYNPFESFASKDDMAATISSLAGSVLNTFNTKLQLIDDITLVPVAEEFAGKTDSYLNVNNKDVNPTKAGQLKIASLVLSDMTETDSKTILGEIFGTLSDEEYAALPPVIKEGVTVIKPDVTTVTAITTPAVTTIADTTTSKSTTITVKIEDIYYPESTTTTTTTSATSSSTSSTSVSSVSSSPATSDKGIAAVAVTGICAAMACLTLRKNRK
ncbi:MAG: hypothetical protein E7505_09160 [Ruminococcus sp.]|nr:hypothetical protein [Ruminococcus sp.]